MKRDLSHEWDREGRGRLAGALGRVRLLQVLDPFEDHTLAERSVIRSLTAFSSASSSLA
ncbi:MAG: hypothetical protein QOE90_507 [Thermoplasmata archaeon]|jgi:hypothetical protein|nr:hypothetical protein [Thermoplasmata archaeon]